MRLTPTVYHPTRARNLRLFALTLGSFIACALIRADISMHPPEGLARKIFIKRGKVQVHLRNSWSSFSVVTRGGKGISLIDPILYGLSPTGKKHLRWPDHGWPRLKWRAMETNKKRDVLYVEGDYEGWRVQAWLALYSEDEALYVRKRTTRIRGRTAGVHAWGNLGVIYGEGDLESGKLNVIVDGTKFKSSTTRTTKPLKDYILFRWPDKSAALVNPGSDFQRRGERAKDFARLLHHPKNRFLETLIPQDSARVAATEFLESTFVLLWGDGDIQQRVKSALDDRSGMVARLPEPKRPAEIGRAKEIVLPRPSGNLPNALLAAAFHAPKGIRKRVYAVGTPVDEAPVIDGKLDDAVWSKPWTAGFIARDTPDVPAGIETSFQCVATAKALYLALRCVQPDLAKIRKARHRPQKWSSGEQVEMFFQAGKKVFQICVDPDGGMCDLLDGNIKVDLKLNLKTAADEKGWIYEIEIPFVELDIPPPEPFDSMGFNLVRNAGVVDGPMEHSGWNAARGAFAGAQNFGTIFFGAEADFRRLNAWHLDMMLDRDVYDTLHASAGVWLDITASSEIPDDAKIAAGILNVEGKLLRASESEADGKRGSLVLNLKGLRPDQYKCRVGLIVGDKAVAETSAHFRVRAASFTPVRAATIPITVQSEHSSVSLPVNLGVPFPRGALTDPSQVRLIDSGGRELPIQSSTLARWDPAGSISWLQVHFQAPKVSPVASRFTLEYGKKSVERAKQAIRVTTLEDVYLVDTGPLRFGVPKENGGVIGNVSLDTNANGQFELSEQLVLSEAAGPYLIDRSNKTYRASMDDKARVEIEKSDTLRIVFRIEGWYVAEDGSKLCKHVTRLSAFAGLSSLRLEHTWIMTAVTGEAAFRDIGFALPTTQNRAVVFGTEGGSFHLYNRFSPYLIQTTEKHYEVQAAYQRLFISDAKARSPIRWRAMVEGARAPGWLAKSGKRGGVVLAVDDFWQNFPKELSIDSNQLTFHVWPRHGRARNRPLTDGTVAKMDFVHSGEVLDFTLPDEMANYKTVNSNEQHFIDAAARSNAIGVAKTHRFALTFFPPATPISEAASEARALADTPHAYANPHWMADSGVFGPMHHRDPEKFPEIERAFDLWSRIVPRLNRLGGWYGMWLYGQLHSTYNLPSDRWEIYRVFNQLHHTGPRWPWLMWARSGQKDLMDFALANTRIVADVGFCHFSRPEFEKLGWPRSKIRGGLTDYKGLVPWHSGSRNPDYNSMTAFLIWHNYFTGYGWTRDVAITWGDLAKRQGPTGGSRTGAGTVRANLDLYQATWDTDLIPVFRKTADALLASQLSDGSFPAWENYAAWIGDYYQFTGQENARTALIRWTDAHLQGHGDNSEMWGNAMNLIAQAWFATLDPRYARAARGYLESWCRSVNDNPDSHLRGIHGGRYGRSLSFLGFHLPRSLIAQKAWSESGKDILPLYPRTWYGSSPKCADGIFRIEVPILDDGDTPVDIRIDGFLHSRGRDAEKKYGFRAVLLDPTGKRIEDRSFTTSQRTWTAHGSTRVAPRKWLKLSVPEDGLKGVYRLMVESEAIEFSLTLPVSNQKEVVPINLDAKGRLLFGDHATMATFYLPAGLKRPVLRITCNESSPQTVQLRNPQFKVVQKFYLSGLYSQVQGCSATIDLPADYSGGFWTLLAGQAHDIRIEFPGDWKPKYYAVEPRRAFRLLDYDVPIKLKP